MDSHGNSNSDATVKQRRGGGNYQSEVDSYAIMNDNENVILLPDESYLNPRLMIDIDFNKEGREDDDALRF